MTEIYRFRIYMKLENIPTNLHPTDPRFGAGPSLIPVEFIQRLLETGPHLLGTSHRKKPVKNLCKEIQDGCRKYFSLPDDYSVVLGNGGATLLFDMIGLGMVEKKSAHFTCGEFSKKWFKSHKLIPWIEAEEIAVDFGQGQQIQNVSGVDMICATLNETSTGVILNNLPEVDDQTILAVDATSGGGQVPCDLSKVDLFFFSPQKVFASEGGFFVAIMSPKARERALRIADDKSRYIPEIMNWKLAIDNSDKNQTYNTPSISTLFFLNEQMKKMNKEGYENVTNSGNEKANHVYDWATNHPLLSCYIEDKAYRSNVVCTIDVDEKIPVDEILAVLENQKIVYGIDAYRKLGRNQFRIGVFNNVSLEDTKKLTDLLDWCIDQY